MRDRSDDQLDRIAAADELGHHHPPEQVGTTTASTDRTPGTQEKS